MRYREHLERGAAAIGRLPSSLASELWVTLPVPPCDRDRFRDAAVSAARRHHIFVLIEERDGVSTAEFTREDRAEVAV